MKKPEQASKSAATAKRILDASIALFAEKGYAATSTKQIAAASVVAEGTLFRYYKTKRDILTAALDRLVQIFADESVLRPIDQVFTENIDAPQKAALKEMLKDRIAVFAEHRQLVKVILFEAQYDDEISKKFYYAIMTKVLPTLMLYMSNGMMTGAFRRMSQDEMMVILRSFLSMAAGYVFQQNYLPNLVNVPREQDLDLMLTLFLSGISA